MPTALLAFNGYTSGESWNAHISDPPSGKVSRKMEASLPERAARVRFGQRLASENDIALVQFVRVA